MEPSSCKTPVLQREESIKPSIERRTNSEHLNTNSKNSNFCTNLEISTPSKTVIIKQELLNENESPTTNCAEASQDQPTLFPEFPQTNHVSVSELPQEKPSLASELPQEKPALVSELPQEKPALVSELSQEKPALVSQLPDDKPALVYSEIPSLDSYVDNKEILNKSLNANETAVKSDILELDQETDYNENHGLNLLLNTIEKVTMFEKVKCPNQAFTPTDLPPFKKHKTRCDPPKETPKIRGIDLLSAIAGQRLVSEFDLIKTETDEEQIKCNYPEIKETKLLPEEDQSRQASEVPANAPKSSVSEIQNILVELKKKYKQKQKELSRLKPKHR